MRSLAAILVGLCLVSLVSLAARHSSRASTQSTPVWSVETRDKHAVAFVSSTTTNDREFGMVCTQPRTCMFYFDHGFSCPPGKNVKMVINTGRHLFGLDTSCQELAFLGADKAQRRSVVAFPWDTLSARLIKARRADTIGFAFANDAGSIQTLFFSLNGFAAAKKNLILRNFNTSSVVENPLKVVGQLMLAEGDEPVR